MKNGLWVMACVLAAAIVPASAQPGYRRANLTGGSGDRGKCTIEVVVDGVAEVEVNGDSGRIRTLEGQRAEWRRFVCSSPLPPRPSDFRFRGIDGRGRVELVRDPRQNRGVAVVRIEDRKSGREGYTFDLEWQSGFEGGGPGGGGGGRDHRDRDRFVVSCSSDDMRRHFCEADTRGGVRLVKQNSEAACREGYSWGYERRGIWVDRGCRADFEVRR